MAAACLSAPGVFGNGPDIISELGGDLLSVLSDFLDN
jgi:hypothetical protein